MTESEQTQDATAEVEVTNGALLMDLMGPGGARVARLERALGLQLGMRGQTLRLQGDIEAVTRGERVIAELLEVLAGGLSLGDADLDGAVALLKRHPEVHLSEIMAPVSVAAGQKISPRGLAQRHYVQTIRHHDIVFGVGPAGTGKTYLAMAMAVSALLEHRVKRIILTRPAVEAGERLGFLPGDMSEKVDPYLRPLYDAMYDMLPNERAQMLLQRGSIEVAPLAFMRGRTLNDSFVILDEAQNTKVSQMRMFLTRVGLRSKAVITGDTTQVDLPPGTHSGLHDATNLLGRVDGIKVCHFSSADVVRHPLVQRIVEAYDARDAMVQAALEQQDDD
ncbi:MAG: PhoH family protein [Myxococcales bacterium]|nr:PhoH family protein [Myxococcales bacterium]